jgi:hypothetical protein
MMEENKKMKMQLQVFHSQSELGGGMSGINGFGAGPSSMIGIETNFSSEIMRPQALLENKRGETGNS